MIVYYYCSYFVRNALSFNLAAYTVISSWQVSFWKFACPQGGAWHQHTLMLDCPQLPVGNPILTQSASQPEEDWKREAERGMNRWDVRDEDWKVWVITDLVRLWVFLLILVALWCLVMTPGASGQLPELTGKKTNAPPSQIHGCLTSSNAICMSNVNTNCSLTILFIWHEANFDKPENAERHVQLQSVI